MPNRKKKRGQSAVKDFITVAFAEDIDLANQYKKLLEENNIPAAVKQQHDSTVNFPGIAVMVPEENLDEAHLLIESQSAGGDFYDMAFQYYNFDHTEDDEDQDAF